MRSICFVSKTHIFDADSTDMPKGVAVEDQENPCLLISVGAKRVLTAWKQKFRVRTKVEGLSSRPANGNSSSTVPPSMSFQWLSTDMPTKSCVTREKSNDMG